MAVLPIRLTNTLLVCILKRFSHSLLGDLWSFDIDTHRWKEIEPKGGIIPSNRHSHVAVALSSTCMLVWGGQCTTSTVNFGDDSNRNSIPQDSLDLNEISEYSGMYTPRAQRRVIRTVPLDEKLCWLFDLTTCVWSPIDCQIKEYDTDSTNGESIEVKSRCGHAGVHLQNGLVLFFAGYSGHMYLKDFVLLDLHRRVQIPISINRKALPPSRKNHRMELFAQGSRIIIFGGMSRKRGRLDDVFIIDTHQLTALCLFGDRGTVQLKSAVGAMAQIEQDLKELGVESPSKRSKTEQNTETNAKDGTWHMNRGTLLLKLRRYRDALSQFDKAIELLSDQFEQERTYAIECRAKVHFMLGNFDGCHKDLLCLKEYQSEQVQYLMAHCLLALGKMGEAASFIESELSKNRTNEALYTLHNKLLVYQRAEEEQRAKGYRNIQYAAGVEMSTYEPQLINALTSTTTVATNNIASAKSVTNSTATTSTNDDDHITLVRLVSYENHYEGDNQLTFDNKNAWNVVLVVGADRQNGCTTFLQQLRMAYQESMSPNECSKYRTAIRKECISIFFALLRLRLLINQYCSSKKRDAQRELLPWDDPFRQEAGEFLLSTYQECESNNDQFLNRLLHDAKYIDMMSEVMRDKNIKALRATESFLRYEFLSNDEFLFGYLSRHKELYQTIMHDNFAFFLNEFETIMSPEYETTTNYVLRLSGRDAIHNPDNFDNASNDLETKVEVSIKEKNTLPFMYKKYPYHMINVIPNSKGKLPPTEKLAQDVTIMMLVVSLGDLDRVESRDSSITGLRTDILGDNLKINSDNNSSLLAGLREFDAICNSSEFTGK
jgi:hypothetical protein